MILLIPAVVAALLAGADPGFDTVFLQNGGRVRGTIVEEDPARGVTIQVPGGEVRTLLPAEVSRIEYRDGSAGSTGSPPQPLPPAAAPPSSAGPNEPAPPPLPAPAEPTPLPPAWPPSSPAERGPPSGYGPVQRPGPGRPYALTLAGSLGFAAPDGRVEQGLEMSEFTSSQLLIGLEAGLRLVPSFVLGAFLDMGFGDSGSVLRDYCARYGTTCSTVDVRLGLMARYVFTPLARQTGWIGVGVSTDVLTAAAGDSNLATPAYGGFEPLRLSVGYDLRGSSQVGLGLFATAAFGRYTDVDDGGGSYEPIASKTSHTWIQGGVRFILFP